MLLISFLHIFVVQFLPTIMLVLKDIKEVDQNHLLSNLGEKSLGFVPTMGALHNGHLALVKKAKEENPVVAVSIFVNPIQFNNQGDLTNYPRTLEKDLDMLCTVLGEKDFVFAPSVEVMYPDEIAEKYDFGTLESVMEGAQRPGHFNGVGVVVSRLFDIIKPAKAYFGEKDFQQLAIIKSLVRQRSYNIEIVPCEIVREPDGLAMSSRNTRLTEENRKNASNIFRLLKLARKRVLNRDDLTAIQKDLTLELNLIPDYQTEYIIFAKEDTLEPIGKAAPQAFRCFIAVYAGEIRLIDNHPMY